MFVFNQQINNRIGKLMLNTNKTKYIVIKTPQNIVIKYTNKWNSFELVINVMRRVQNF